MSTTALATRNAAAGASLVSRIAERFGVDPSKMLGTLKATAFRQTGRDAIEPTNEQMMALLAVAEQYNLNPFTRELYAFPDKQRGIVPIVSVDGWIRIINEHPALDGIEFRAPPAEEWALADADAKASPEWIECVIHRRDRQHPIGVREYLDECYRPAFVGKSREGGSYKTAGPWQSHTKRMLRHKALIQCARVAFGFAGIYDPDEGDRIIEGQLAEGPEHPKRARRRPARLSAPQALAEPEADIEPEEPAGVAQADEVAEADYDDVPEEIAPPAASDEAEDAESGDAAPAAPSVDQLVAALRTVETIDSVAEIEDLARELKPAERNRVKNAAADARRRLGAGN